MKAGKCYFIRKKSQTEASENLGRKHEISLGKLEVNPNMQSDSIF